MMIQLSTPLLKLGQIEDWSTLNRSIKDVCRCILFVLFEQGEHDYNESCSPPKSPTRKAINDLQTSDTVHHF